MLLFPVERTKKGNPWELENGFDIVAEKVFTNHSVVIGTHGTMRTLNIASITPQFQHDSVFCVYKDYAT